MTYTMKVAGLERELPLCKVSDELYIGAFIIFGDAELTVACASALLERLKKTFRAGIDLSDNSPGWKFAQYEMKGVPLRLELGPKDIEKGQCVLVRRDTREKTFVPLDRLEEEVARLLRAVQGVLGRAF